MARWSRHNELSFWRNYDKNFDCLDFNQQLIGYYCEQNEVLLACLDASFIPKSGHHTTHLGVCGMIISKKYERLGSKFACYCVYH
jgi:hypothetical protein